MIHEASGSARQRLFFALWPDEDVRARLAPLVDAYDGRPVSRENLHLTLVFLGEVDADARACCERAAGEVAFAPFELVITDVQWQRRRGIVWAAAAEVPSELARLVSGLSERLADCGQVPESRRFRAHVTLARHVRRGRPVRIAPIRWPVDRFCLVSSRLSPGGSRYTVERCWPVAPGAAYQ